MAKINLDVGSLVVVSFEPEPALAGTQYAVPFASYSRDTNCDSPLCVPSWNCPLTE